MNVLLTSDLPRIENEMRQLAHVADAALTQALAVLEGGIALDSVAWQRQRHALVAHQQQIEQLCANSIVRTQVTGEALRFLTLAIMVASDFRRVGSMACDLALEFAGVGRGKPPGLLELCRLADRASTMLRACSNALWHLDDRVAAAIVREHGLAAGAASEIANCVMTAIRHGSPQAAAATAILGASRHLHRTTEILAKTAMKLAQLSGQARTSQAESPGVEAPDEACA